MFTRTLLGLALLCPTIALAQQVVPPADTVNCAYNLTPPTLTTGQMGRVQCDSAGNFVISGSINAGTPNGPATATATQGVMLGAQFNTSPTAPTNGQQGSIPMDISRGLFVGGTIPSAGTDAGNPVKVGGVYNSSAALGLTNGQRGDMQLNANGDLRAMVTMRSATGSSGATNTVGFPTRSGTDVSTAIPAAAPYLYNGSTLDQEFTCPNSVAISVTAGNTTELVPLTSTQIIRICSFAITISLAGSAQFVYGTGTNCAGSPVNLTGAMAVATNASIALSAGNGSLFRGIASNAVCLTAVTGNVTGFLSFVKF